MLDCACLADVVALKHFRRPEVEVVGDEVIVVSPDSLALYSHSTFRTFLRLDYN